MTHTRFKEAVVLIDVPFRINKELVRRTVAEQYGEEREKIMASVANRSDREFDEVFEELGGEEPEEKSATKGTGLFEEEEVVADGDDPSTLPDWAALPEGFKMPLGKQVIALRFRAKWTDYPKRGDRWCLLWNLTEADEKLALKRTRGEGIRAIDELAKQTVRVIDGLRTDWVALAGAGSMRAFWDEVGGKCRQQVKNVYAKRHTMSQEELTDFFTDCIAVATVAG